MYTENNQKPQLIFFTSIFLAIVVLSFLIFLPFFNVLALAAILAVVVHPIYKKVLIKLHSPNLAALFVVVIAGGLIVFMLAFVGSNIFEESRGLYGRLLMGDYGFVDAVEKPIQNLFPQIAFDIKSYVDEMVSLVGIYTAKILTATAASVFNIMLGIVAFFYFLKDGTHFKKQLMLLSPLRDDLDNYIFDKLEVSINAIVKGTLLVAMIQGALAGLGMAVLGVPNATLWGALTVIAALVPGFGTTIIIIPAVLYLFVIGFNINALILLAWGILMVGLIDNALAPLLYSRGTHVHPLIILFSVLGGISFFGPIGFLFGPIVLSLLYVLLHVYKTITTKGTLN